MTATNAKATPQNPCRRDMAHILATPRDGPRLSDPHRRLAGAHLVAGMQLAPAARLRLAVDGHRARGQQRLGLAAGVREAGHLQQLAEPDDAVACVDLVDVRMMAWTRS